MLHCADLNMVVASGWKLAGKLRGMSCFRHCQWLHWTLHIALDSFIDTSAWMPRFWQVRIWLSCVNFCHQLFEKDSVAILAIRPVRDISVGVPCFPAKEPSLLKFVFLACLLDGALMFRGACEFTGRFLFKFTQFTCKLQVNHSISWTSGTAFPCVSTCVPRMIRMFLMYITIESREKNSFLLLQALSVVIYFNQCLLSQSFNSHNFIPQKAKDH